MADETETARITSTTPDRVMIGRWRLVLGRIAEERGLDCPADERLRIVSSLLDHLFGAQANESSNVPSGSAPGTPATPGRPKASGKRGAARTRSGSAQASRSASDGDSDRSREGGSGPPTWTVPRWVEAVRELFPVEAKEVMEKEYVKRHGIAGLLREPRLLERVEPNVELVKILITHKTLLNEQTRPVARALIDRVVQQIKTRLRLAVEPALVGALRHDRHSPRKVFRNLDLTRTVHRNLKNYDVPSGRLLVERLYFYAAERKKRPWHVIVLVDQSGSMLESAVFSAIMASIFAGIPAVRTSLVLFSTEVLDLSDQVGEPVDVLLSVQLGGGTHIGKAMRYAEQLIREPQRTIVVLISDFHEGGDPDELLRQTELMAEAGVRMIGLGALSYEGCPAYSHRMAIALRRVGLDVLVFRLCHM